MISRGWKNWAVLVVVTLFSGAAAHATPLNPENYSSLSTLSDFAAFVTAISLAYAGLNNFRYRTRVMTHVRKIADANLISNLITNQKLGGHVCADESWAILYRLGRLKEVPETPQPSVPGDETDYNFRKRLDYRAYDCLYANNLDKIISISIGAAASTVIWFSAIDAMLFPDPHKAGVWREIYFGNIAAFYLVLALVAVVGFIIHLRVPLPEIWPPKDRNLLKQTKWVGATLFFFGVALATVSKMAFGHYAYTLTQPDTVAVVLDMAAITLLAEAITLPFLLVIGENLTWAMVKECNRCRDRLEALLGATAGSAKVEPAKGAGGFPLIIRP